jgi:hypothetical protein
MKQVRSGGDSAVRRQLAAVLAAAALLLALGSASASAQSPVDGNASWIWYVSKSGGTAKAIAKRAKRSGLDAVFIKSADGTNTWSQFTPGLVSALHARGLSVCGWQFVYGRNPTAEARAGAQAAEAGADCLIIDAESALEGQYAAADTYLRKLRSLVGSDYQLGLSSFPYVDYHPAFPYSVFLGPDGADFNLPQVYWHTIGDPVVNSLTHTYVFNRPYDIPLYPVGQTYADPPRRDLKAFRRYARAFGAEGVSWWSWQETSKREWKALHKRVGRAKGFHPDQSYPELGPGDSGDLVVWAQELLAGAGESVAVNGKYNGRTERAVGNVQATQGLPVTGEIDDRTWKRLLSAPPIPVRWAAPRTVSGARVGAEREPASATMSPLGTDVPPFLEASG